MNALICRKKLSRFTMSTTNLNFKICEQKLDFYNFNKIWTFGICQQNLNFQNFLQNLDFWNFSKKFELLKFVKKILTFKFCQLKIDFQNLLTTNKNLTFEKYQPIEFSNIN